MLNNRYINIVKKNPESIAPENGEGTVNKILKHYENHQSVSKIKCSRNEALNFDFPTAKVEDINKIIESLNTRKLLGQMVSN